LETASTLAAVLVDYGPDAKEQLLGLGKPTGAMVDMELRTLFDTRSFPDGFTRLDVQHNPPWWHVRLNSAYAAVVRACSPAELTVKGGSEPRIVVGLIVASGDDLRAVEKRMIAEAKGVDGEEGPE
jgi:hypothetical protein